MALPQRHARRLRLMAASDEAAHAAVPRLEDALRCASLPDAGARFMLVRRLSLGRIPAQGSTQSLARLIERRLDLQAVRWTEGAIGDARDASHVVFASAWHARVALARRLLRDHACTAWYWPLAVPGFRAAEDVAANLSAIARGLALSEEARVALPAWACALASDGLAPRLAAVLPEPFGVALVEQAGLRMRVPSSQGIGRDVSSSVRLPAWLDSVLDAGGGPVRQYADASAQVRGGTASMPSAGPALHLATPPMAKVPGSAATLGQQRAPADDGERGVDRVRALESATGSVDFEGPAVAIDAALGRATDVEPMAPAGGDRGEDFALLAAMPTRAAGLLFLLPVLDRLGLPRRAERAGGDAAAWTRAILCAVLDRLRLAADDPIRALVGDAAPLLPHALRGWLAELRGWLRRHAGIGLARLVLRPGGLGLTPTHADLHFGIDAVDLRVRRIGLDIDPGWLPWFGRVVTFHYGDAPRSP
ncbi:hypothetical protein QTH87_04795 [Variovorax sp. J22P168]|uniref:hypothetical protein n=1 Tax=Variovorax jilinensis TaxID=3053513 RepID=UPI0025778BDB|nr:hypothetical protein [Variovorax sp. J22P168]MDM0011750.1 hypothetical protein [Variovorax sp. J22P168]